MQIFTARVRHGRIALEDGVTLPDGTVVTVVVPDAEADSVEVTPEEESELLAAIEEVERGETITAAELFERLRK